NRLPAAVYPKPIRQFAVVHRIEDRNVGVFAGSEASLAVLQSQSTCAIEGGGRDGLGRRHLHVSAGDGKHKWHGGRRRGSWIVVWRQSDGNSGEDEVGSGGKGRESEKVIGGGKRRGSAIGFAKPGDVAVG